MEHLCTSDFNERILVLVDGLDAALSYDAEDNIVTLLARVTNSASGLPPQLRFLMTSRSDPRVFSQISGEMLDLVKDDIWAREEILQYVFVQLHMLPEPERMSLATRIAEAADGNFLYARYVVQTIVSEPGRTHDLSELALPSGLGGVYRSFLKRDLGLSIERWNDAFRPLLGVIAEAHGDGLTVTQLAGITGSSLSATINRLQVLEQFLCGQLPAGPFRLFHKSFKDFLIQDSDFNIYPSEVNEWIADFFMEEYRDCWTSCEDQYARHYTFKHLVDALKYSSDQRARRRIMTKLTQLLADQNYLNAMTKGFDRIALSSDVERVIQMVSEEVGTGREEGQKLAEMLAGLRSEIRS